MTYSIYEMQDLLSHFLEFKFTHSKQNFPEATIRFDSNYITISAGMLIQLIGYNSANAQVRLFKGTYNFGDNEVGDDEDDIDFIDSYNLYDGDCRIVHNFDGHSKVLRLQDDTTPGEDPYLRHNEIQLKHATKEFWIGSNDVSAIDTNIYYYESGVGTIIQLRLVNSKIYYVDGGGNHEIQAIVDNTLYHIKIAWRTDSKFDLYVDGILRVNDVACYNNMVDGIDIFYIYHYGDSTNYCYLDAYGDVDNDSDYDVGDNQYIEEGGEEQVVFEGIAEQPTLGVIQYVVVKNQGSEMVYVEPAGEYTDDTDGVIADILADTTIGRSYLREGTLADGADLGTIKFKGNKKLQKLLDEFATFDGYTWYQNPIGEVDYNAGNVCTDVDIRFDGSGNLDTILEMNARYISGVNKVIVIGAMDSANGVRYSGSWDDQEDQQLNDITLLVVWNTALNTNAKCTSLATAIGTQEGSTRTRAEFKFRKTTYGFIQPGQTITLKYDVAGFMTISEAQYIVDGITIDAISEVGWIRASSGLVFKFGKASEELPEQNSALIEQTNEDRAVNPTAEASAWTIFGDGIDSLIGYISGGVPRIKVIGGSLLQLESDNASLVYHKYYDDATNYFSVGFNKTSDYGLFYCTGSIYIQPSGYTDDYLYFTTVANIAYMLPVEDKVHYLGSATLSYDHVYSDDFDNTSPFKKFEDPISDLKKIKGNIFNDQLDYKSLPNWIRSHSRNPNKHIWGKKTIIEKIYNEETEEYEEIEVEKDYIIKRSSKDVVEEKGFSINRGLLLVIQAIQKLVERVEALEES